MPEISIAKIYAKIIGETNWMDFSNPVLGSVQVRQGLVKDVERELNLGTIEALGLCAQSAHETLPELKAIPGDYRQLKIHWTKPIKRTVFWLLHPNNQVYLSDIQFAPFAGQDLGEVMKQWEKNFQRTPPAR